ncbi:MAG: phthalate 4,5-cis-dihydrodiol dehydrogenase [Alphaproteobacteria bacterium]|jgi:phthalate 4,5-cis-dihydrodiol dehydrogenase|nr:phthalate 4,5-cis-dihydrodiol dehydrogenase [Alphaproteobacteria bacterium]
MAALAEPPGASAAPAQILRLGIAGLGVASTLFLPGVEQSPHTRIVAAADRRRSALDAFERKYRGRTYGSVEDLCADPDIDVIWVATPNQFHCRHTVLAAEHGKHVICTKPMALTVDECETMCLAAERNGVKLLCGQTYSMSPDVQAMWAVTRGGELGRLIAIHSWLYTDWLLKPRVPEETDEAMGGGVVYRHAPHLIDTVRLLAGGRVRSVRAAVGRWMPERPCPGNFSAYLEFEDGTPATIAYNGYGYFDTSELTWGIGNRMYADDERVRVRHALRRGEIDAEVAKEGMRFGAGAQNAASRGSGHQATPAVGTRAHIGWFGITVASFERGDVRQSPNGIFVYDDNGRREVPVHGGRGTGMLEMKEMHEAVVAGTPITHDGRWAMATLEVGSAIVASARERREIMLSHQCGLAR